MGKKKILVFIDWYLPGFRAGGPIRSCANMVAHLSDEFDFYIITSDTDYMSTSQYKSVKINDWNILPDGSSVYYISKDKLNASTIKFLLKKNDVDYYYMNGIYSYLFTQVPLQNIDKKKKKVIVAVRGMLAPSALSIKFFKKKLFFLYVKLTGLFDDIIFHTTTPQEKNQTESIFKKSRIQLAPNLSRTNTLIYTNQISKKENELRLLNIARIAPEKNLLFALEILKNVRSRVVFDFFGPIYNETYWDECKKIISFLPENITAVYKGVIEDEYVFSIMKNYHFLFLPTRGENFGHIILESFSSGLPAIISDQTPWNNLQLKNAGFDLTLQTPFEFSRVIDRCAQMSADEYSILSSGASRLAESFIKDEEKVNANRLLFS